MNLPPNVAITVVGTHHRPILTEECLQGIPHQTFYTTDYPLDPAWQPDESVTKLMHVNMSMQKGPMRCFRGHQDAVAALPSSTEVAIVFEDDAVPNRPDWLVPVLAGLQCLDEVEVVSFHGRELKNQSNPRVIDGHTFWELLPWGGLRHHLGSLAYAIRKDAFPRLLAARYGGMPYDFFFANAFSFRVLDPSPFIHDRRHGSLNMNPA